MKNNMIKALKTRYDAAYQEAHCTLEIYLNKYNMNLNVIERQMNVICYMK